MMMPAAISIETGTSNLRESKFGTDPRDASSIPQASIEPMPDGRFRVTVPTYPGRFYRIETSPEPQHLVFVELIASARDRNGQGNLPPRGIE